MNRVLRLRQLVPRTRQFSYTPPHAVENDNSSTVGLLGLGAVVGGMAYVYYDPDVLPESIRKWLPIQEPEGKAMSLEEYEEWRAKQNKYPTGKSKEKEEEDVVIEEDTDTAAPPEIDNPPLVKKDLPPAEMRASLLKLLDEARENEAAFLDDLKKSRTRITDEERQMKQAFKDEKARIKKQLKSVPEEK